MLESIAGDLFNGFSDSSYFEPISDFFSGYTSANAANRFMVSNMERQQKYNKENMQLEDEFQRRLMADSPSIQRSGLESAGFNPLLAVAGGISSPNSAAHASLPTASGPAVNSQLGNLISMASTAMNGYAMLSKLSSEVSLNKSQSAAASASALRDTASAEKIAKESASIDPEIIRQNNRFGDGFSGDLLKLGRELLGNLGYDWDSRPFANSSSADSAKTVDTLDSVSSHSAQSIEQNVKRLENKILPRMRHETKHDNKKSRRRHN